VYAADCTKKSTENITFDLAKVQQLNPTITAKMFFSTLNVIEVKKYYDEEFK
jgi:hypothetical protein